MIAFLIVASVAVSDGPTTVTPVMMDFDLAKVRPREATCADRGQSDDILVCASKNMDVAIGDMSRFATKPLRPEFSGPLHAETTVHVIQQSSPAAVTPAAAITFKWHF